LDQPTRHQTVQNTHCQTIGGGVAGGAEDAGGYTGEASQVGDGFPVEGDKRVQSEDVTRLQQRPQDGQGYQGKGQQHLVTVYEVEQV